MASNNLTDLFFFFLQRKFWSIIWKFGRRKKKFRLKIRRDTTFISSVTQNLTPTLQLEYARCNDAKEVVHSIYRNIIFDIWENIGNIRYPISDIRWRFIGADRMTDTNIFQIIGADQIADTEYFYIFGLDRIADTKYYKIVGADRIADTK